MRTVTQGLLDALTDNRVVDARVTIWDPRLRFDDMRVSQVDYINGDAVHAYDDAIYNNGVLRIAVIDNAGTQELWGNYISDFDTIWPDWFNTGIILRPNSRPGIFGNKVCYLNSAYQLCTRTFNGTAFVSQTVLETLPTGSTADIAMVSSNIFYMHYHPQDTYVYGYVLRKDIATPANDKTWDGITKDASNYGGFDALSYQDVEYVYYSDRGFRAKGMKVLDEGEWWGKPFDIVPLDIVDETSLFRLGHASVVNGEVFVCGVLKRPSAPGMHIYMKGPEKFTMGRDLYIATAETDVFQWNYEDLTSIDVDVSGGKLHFIDEYLWYLGPLIAYRAEATTFAGYDHPDRKFTTDALNDIQLQCSTTSSHRLTFELDTTIDHPALREGSLLELEFAIGGNWVTMGIFGVDVISEIETPSGEGLQIGCRSSAIKALSHWQPDADYDYWGQTKQAGNPYDMSKVVRAEGLWDQIEDFGNNVISLTDLNVGGILYATGMPGDGTIGRGLFKYPDTTDYQPLYGVIVNYENKEYLDVGDIEVMGHYGIGALYGPDQHSGAPGVGVYYFADGAKELITSFALTIPVDTWHWIQASFEDGRFIVHYRLDSGTDWTLVGSVIVVAAEDSVYPGLDVISADVAGDEDEYRGRAALYVENRTPYTIAAGIHSRSEILGVDDIDFAEIGETIVIHSEQMTITGKTAAPSATPGDLTWIEGFTFDNASHWKGDPNNFPGYEVYFEGTTAFGETEFNDMALVVFDGPGAGRTLKIVAYDRVAPAQWVPSVTYTEPDKWTDHVGQSGHGSWQPSNTQRVFVEESPSGIFGEGSIAKIVPALSITRGENDTQATTHGVDTVVSVYRNASVYTRDFHFLTTHQDRSFTEVAFDIARKAGLSGGSTWNRVSGTLSQAGPGWSLDFSATEQALRNLIVDFDPVAMGASAGFGVAFAVSKVDDVYTGGRIVMVFSDKVELWTYETTPVLLEKFMFCRSGSTPDLVTGPIRISIQDEFITLWIADRHVHTFIDREAPLIESANLIPDVLYSGIILYNAVSVDVNWPELDRYVDNFVMNMGARGSQLMEQLVGERRVYYQDDQAGNLRIFQKRTVINPGSPISMIEEAGKETSDMEMITRLRLEGGTIAEQFDPDYIKEHGNIFVLVNSTELDRYEELYDETLELLDEAKSRSKPLGLIGMADPRVEPGDIVEVALPSETIHVLVETVSFGMSIDETSAVFEMNMEAYRV